MAILGDPVGKASRRLGVAITPKGAKVLQRRPNPPGQHGGDTRPRKISDYAAQLLEKQKCRYFYGVSEKQFRRTFDKALRMPGATGENLLMLLEERLDNVVYRLGWADTRQQARQIVNHGHIAVNGVRTDIASYTVRPGDTIVVTARSAGNRYFKERRQIGFAHLRAPDWLQRSDVDFTARALAKPRREQAEGEIAEHIIVEFYSR